MLTELVALTDPRWRARAQNIYAGRTISVNDTAFSDQNVRSGMVALSNQFTSVLIAYAAMYGIFLQSMDDAKVRSPEDAAAIQRGMRAEFDEIVHRFRIGGLLALKGTPLMIAPSEEHWEAVDILCRAAEQWTLAHELSHHLARDMSTRRDKGVEELLRQLKSRSAMRSVVADLPPSQRCEAEADLLATLILARHFMPEGHDPNAVRYALPGAAIALIAVAHLRDEWTAAREDSHPGCMDRLRILMTFICEIYGTDSIYPNDLGRSHMTLSRFASTLMAFAHWAEDVERATELKRLRLGPSRWVAAVRGDGTAG